MKDILRGPEGNAIYGSQRRKDLKQSMTTVLLLRENKVIPCSRQPLSKMAPNGPIHAIVQFSLLKCEMDLITGF